MEPISLVMDVGIFFSCCFIDQHVSMWEIKVEMFIVGKVFVEYRLLDSHQFRNVSSVIIYTSDSFIQIVGFVHKFSQRVRKRGRRKPYLRHRQFGFPKGMRYHRVIKSFVLIDFPNHDSPEYSVGYNWMRHSNHLLFVILKVVMHHINHGRPVPKRLLKDLIMIQIANSITIEKV